MRIYDYYETGDGTRVTHSDVRPDGSVLVFFDNAGKHAAVKLPDGVVESNDGFDDAQVSSFLISAARGVKSIMRYAREGGVEHAWAV